MSVSKSCLVSLCPCLRLGRERDRQMTGALANRGGSSLSARPEALDGGPLVSKSLTHEKIVLDQFVVVLGVGHSRLQELAPVASYLTRGEGEDSACLIYRLAPQVTAHHARLACRGPHVAGLGAHHLAAGTRGGCCGVPTSAARRLFGLDLCLRRSSDLLSLGATRLLCGRLLSPSLLGGGLLGLGRVRLLRLGGGLLSGRRLLGGRLLCRRLLLRAGGLVVGDSLSRGLLLGRLLSSRLLSRGLLSSTLLSGGLLGSSLRGRRLLHGIRLGLGSRLCLLLALGRLLLYRLLTAHRPFPEPAGPRNMRVGANSPSLWPTIDSLMNTGTCFLPSWTANVWPTMSGKIVDARDQVLSIFLVLAAFMASMRVIKRSSTQGPFLLDLLIAAYPSLGDDRALCTCRRPCSSCACDNPRWVLPKA